MKVSVVTLTNGTRPAMLARAIRCVVASTHPDIEHIVFDAAPYAGRTIGYIRNIANACANGELIAHADDDDFFHPRRLEEQVALLGASGKQCVGYRELLFWDTRCPEPQPVQCPVEDHPILVRADGSILAHYDSDGSICPAGGATYGEAWLYTNHQANWAVGASLMYRRELWQRQPFDDAPHEDTRWLRTPLVSGECSGVSAIPITGDAMPRMVCQIHGGNSEGYDRAVMLRNPDVWRRAPEFDEYCEGVMRCA